MGPILAAKGSGIIRHYIPPMVQDMIWQPRRSLYLAWKPFAPLYRQEPSLIRFTFHSSTGAAKWIMSTDDVLSWFFPMPGFLFVTLRLCGFGHPLDSKVAILVDQKCLDPGYSILIFEISTPVLNAIFTAPVDLPGWMPLRRHLGSRAIRIPGTIIGGFKVEVHAEPCFKMNFGRFNWSTDIKCGMASVQICAFNPKARSRQSPLHRIGSDGLKEKEDGKKMGYWMMTMMMMMMISNIYIYIWRLVESPNYKINQQGVLNTTHISHWGIRNQVFRADRGCSADGPR